MLDRSGLWLGFSAVPLENELAKAFNIGTRFGLLIQQVAYRSPSYYIGLEGGTIPAHIGSRDVLLGGDVLVEIMGVPIDATPESYEAIQARIEEIDEGERIEFVVIRGASAWCSRPRADSSAVSSGRLGPALHELAVRDSFAGRALVHELLLRRARAS